MEFRQLRYFMAVAEHLHFTRAAEALHMAQPPLSQQILKLEREIGTPLFNREGRGVSLTAAGERFYLRAARILQDSRQAMQEVQSIARGTTGVLSIGFAGSVAFHPRPPQIVRAFRQRYPQLQLTSHESDSPQLIERVYQADIDCAFVRRPVDCGELASVDITSEELVAVLPQQHSLESSERIALGALAGEPFILFPREIGPRLYDYVIDSCRESGFLPDIVMEAPQLSSIANMVAAGFGISLIPASMSQIQLAGVCYRHLQTPVPRSTITYVYRFDEQSAAVLNLREMLIPEIPD